MTIWRVFKTTRVPHKFWVYHTPSNTAWWTDDISKAPTEKANSTLDPSYFEDDTNERELEVPWGNKDVCTDSDLLVDDGL